MAADTILDFRNTNALWCSVLAETLHRLGLRTVVASPGSRSTPLTMSFVRHGGFDAIPALDERSAAFFALGVAKRERRATILVCTSGTAGANYLPAVIEAHESGVPLLVITADRPPEMRECASGQTIDQQKIFGGHVSWYHELAVPEPRVELLRYLRQTLAHAVERAQAGPVHLNAPFRDPLPPVADASAQGLAGALDETFFAHLGVGGPAPSTSTLWQRPTTARGLIVAGTDAPADPAGYARKVLELSAALGWPVLADVLSPLRQNAPAGVVVTAYDSILRNAHVARELAPRTVLCLGGWPTSKVLRAWLEASGAEVLLIATSAPNRDALHGKTRQIVAPVESLAVLGEKVADDSYARAWARAENAARSALDGALAGNALGGFEGRAAWLLARALPAGTPLFVANSMPVRDLEYLWPATNRGLQVYFSRGANGIDGTLSTALGIAHGAAKPAVLLTGDLALLHDTNGFLHRARLRGALTVVLINNDGGGIFEHLPIAQFNPPFEAFWATPQGVDFAALCAAHHVEHVAVRDWAQFEALISELPGSGVRVLEIRTDRRADAATRKRLFAEVAAAVGAAAAR